MKRLSWFVGLLFVAVLLVPAVHTKAQQDPQATSPGLGPNVMITMTVGNVDEPGAKVRTYRFLGRDGTAAAMLMGWRMPIPTSHSRSGDDDTAPVTSYVYQNVGVTAELEIDVLSDGRVLLAGEIEISGTREGTPPEQGATAPPMIGTFQQALNVILREEQPIRVAQVPDPEGKTLYLQVEVDVLD